MDIQISRDSDFPIRQQLTEQIVFLIATGRLRPGQDLPSVRALARRLKIITTRSVRPTKTWCPVTGWCAGRGAG